MATQQQSDHAVYDTRELKLARRQALLIELAAIERDLGLPRTIERKTDRERSEYVRRRQHILTKE